MKTSKSVGMSGYAGLFFITLSTLMYEVLLTRIFSVTMWYHFAFMAISIAMFGMTVGAIVVYLFPSLFTTERAKYHLTLSAFLFAVTLVISFWVHLNIPFVFQTSIVGIFSIAATYIVVSVPFLFSGICVCIALTKFPAQVSKLYAVDLVGAAIGCFLLILTLSVTDGMTAVMVVAGLASLGGTFFALGGDFKKLLAVSCLLTFIFFGFSIVNTYMVNQQKPLLSMKWVKGARHGQPLYEKWNSFSYFKIIGDPDGPAGKPGGWGLSQVCPKTPVKQLLLMIDAFAGTPLTDFEGDFKKLEFLKYDIINLVHYLRKDAAVCVVGVGGGRDILSAKIFGQKSVVGVEINPDIIDAVNNRFADYTGHITDLPGVTIVNDEARSYIAKTKEKFDIIQVSFIDTWAATAAGAFVLTENSLYTVEAWMNFYEHLSERGILTFSRWYFADSPSEVYRLTALATQALLEMGIDDPRKHMLLVRNMFVDKDNIYKPDGVGTILVSMKPFTGADINMINSVSDRLRYEVVLSPDFAIDDIFKKIASGKGLIEYTENFPVNISPTTDNKPFFFNMLRLRDIFSKDLMKQGSMSFNMKAVFILGALLCTVIILTILCIVVPLLLTLRRVNLDNATPFLLYFALIGLGFMLVEIALMQRLVVFLGQPVYSLSVVLFSLLISGGLGSWSTQRIDYQKLQKAAFLRLGLLLIVILALNKGLLLVLNEFQTSPNSVRILISICMLCPIGFLMGMAFPIGMKAASGRAQDITAWLWGINGATSVCASVGAIVISLAAGISVTYLCGFICYVLAFVSFYWAMSVRGDS
jgi:hypothetical protein